MSYLTRLSSLVSPGARAESSPVRDDPRLAVLLQHWASIRVGMTRSRSVAN